MISDFLVEDMFNGRLNEHDFKFLQRVLGWRGWKREGVQRGCIKVARTVRSLKILIKISV